MTMNPKRHELIGAALLVLFLVTLIAVIVFFAIPPEGAPTLR